MGELRAKHERQLRQVCTWLFATGYPIDWTAIDLPPPPFIIRYLAAAAQEEDMRRHERGELHADETIAELGDYEAWITDAIEAPALHVQGRPPQPEEEP